MEKVEALRQKLTAQRQDLVDELHGAIGITPAMSDKRLLINVRRSSGSNDFTCSGKKN